MLTVVYKIVNKNKPMIFNAFALGEELEKNVVFGLEFEQQENRTMIFKSCTMTLCIAFCFVTLRYVTLRYVTCAVHDIVPLMTDLYLINILNMIKCDWST